MDDYHVNENLRQFLAYGATKTQFTKKEIRENLGFKENQAQFYISRFADTHGPPRIPPDKKPHSLTAQALNIHMNSVAVEDARWQAQVSTTWAFSAVIISLMGVMYSFGWTEWTVWLWLLLPAGLFVRLYWQKLRRVPERMKQGWQKFKNGGWRRCFAMKI